MLKIKQDVYLQPLSALVVKTRALSLAHIQVEINNLKKFSKKLFINKKGCMFAAAKNGNVKSNKVQLQISVFMCFMKD